MTDQILSVEEEWTGQDDEFNPIDIPQEFRDVCCERVEMSVRELCNVYFQGCLILQPDFQRGYVWDVSRASRFIESLLLGLPIPAIFISQEDDQTWSVIDGHQRLETLFRYMGPLLSGPSSHFSKQIPKYCNIPPLRLQYIEVLRELNGTTVAELPGKSRAKLWDTKLEVIKLPSSCHKDMKYVLFARLNQGSMSLNNQELRNCLYRGKYNQLLASLSENARFLSIWGKKSPDKRMRHRELVLRFFALLHRFDEYRMPYRAFLNDEMESNKDLNKVQIADFSGEFEVALDWTERVFGKEAFRIFRCGTEKKYLGHWERRRFDLMYEVETVSFARVHGLLTKITKSMNKGIIIEFEKAIRNQLISVMVNPSFLGTLSEGTTQQHAVRTRFALWNQTLENIIDNNMAIIDDWVRLSKLVNDFKPCPICGQIVQMDDAKMIGHQNSERVVHRFCSTITK